MYFLVFRCCFFQPHWKTMDSNNGSGNDMDRDKCTFCTSLTVRHDEHLEFKFKSNLGEMFQC